MKFAMKLFSLALVFCPVYCTVITGPGCASQDESAVEQESLGTGEVWCTTPGGAKYGCTMGQGVTECRTLCGEVPPKPYPYTARCAWDDGPPLAPYCAWQPH